MDSALPSRRQLSSSSLSMDTSDAYSASRYVVTLAASSSSAITSTHSLESHVTHADARLCSTCPNTSRLCLAFTVTERTRQSTRRLHHSQRMPPPVTPCRDAGRRDQGREYAEMRILHVASAGRIARGDAIASKMGLDPLHTAYGRTTRLLLWARLLPCNDLRHRPEQPNSHYRKPSCSQFAPIIENGPPVGPSDSRTGDPRSKVPPTPIFFQPSDRVPGAER